MKHILTLTAVVFATACFGQDECDLTYDGNGDGVVGSADLIDLLAEVGTCIDSVFVQCGDPLLFDDHLYNTVSIADRCWFAENLRTRVYSNGDPISTVNGDDEWQDYPAEGRVSVYGDGNDCLQYSPEIDACDTLQSLPEYGRLYNWYAATDYRNACPSGWHVPSDEDWMELELTLGVSESDADNTGWRGTNEGEQLKAESGWITNQWLDGNGTDDFGFTAIPGGMRYAQGSYGSAGSRGWWWSSTGSTQSAWCRRLEDDESGIWRSNTQPFNGFSIRCIQDSVELTSDGQQSCSLAYDGNLDGAVGSADLIGLLAEFGYECPPDMEFACGEALGYQGHDYETVEIAGRCWFAENLRTETYSNGDDIPIMSETNLFSETGHLAINDVVYYQWGVTTDSRGVCPSGWQVPSLSDYETLPISAPLVAHPYGSLLHGVIDCCDLVVSNNGPFGPYEYSWTRDESNPSEGWRFVGTASSSSLGDSPKYFGATLRCIKDPN